MRVTAVVLGVCAGLSAGCAVAAGDDATGTTSSAAKQQNQAPRHVSVPGQIQTIQGAVDAVADGGTVLIAPGSYFENIVVSGKHVKLRGQSALGQTTISGVNQGPVITFLANAGGAVRDLVIESGSIGIFAHELQGIRPDRVRLIDVAVDGFEWAIAGSFDQLEINGATIHNPFGNGIGVSARALRINDSSVIGTKGIGLLVRNVPGKDCGTSIKGSHFDSNLGKGIEIDGHGCPVFIKQTSADSNHEVGIDLRETGPALLLQTSADDTQAVSALWGDGLRVLSSPVTLSSCDMSNNERAGVSVYGCTAAGKPASASITDTTLDCDDFPIAAGAADLTLSPIVECTSGFTLNDGGGNACSSGSPCASAVCAASTSGAAEPAPVPDFPP